MQIKTNTIEEVEHAMKLQYKVNARKLHATEILEAMLNMRKRTMRSMHECVDSKVNAQVEAHAIKTALRLLHGVQARYNKVVKL